MVSSEETSGFKIPTWVEKVAQSALALVSLFLFLIALELITNASHTLSSGYTSTVFRLTANPFVSLCIGILFTAIIQSSSTLTSTLVAMVASGLISVEAAVPMVLGANIGTTVTAVLVSFANLGTPKVFKRGFAVANSHVLFNVVTAAPFLFMEARWEVLSLSSSYLARQISVIGHLETGWFAFYTATITPLTSLLQSIVINQPLVILACALVLLFMCIFMLTTAFRYLILGSPNPNAISLALKNPLISFLSGAGLTAAIHSSSVTTSISVMLAATEKVSPKKLFPYILGANVGTTITTLMAAIGRSESAIAIALTHFIFNALGVLLFYPIPFVRNIPMAISQWMAIQTSRKTVFAFAYLILLFYALPLLVIYFSEK